MNKTDYEFKNPDQAVIFDYLKKAKIVAIIGLSDRLETSSNRVARAIQQAGYRVIPVNPKLVGSELLGEKVYGSLREIPFHVDIVDIFRRSEFLAGLARDFIETDADVYWAQQGLQSQEAEEILRAAGRNQIVMNRCIKVEHAYSGIGRKEAQIGQNLL